MMCRHLVRRPLQGLGFGLVYSIQHNRGKKAKKDKTLLNHTSGDVKMK